MKSIQRLFYDICDTAFHMAIIHHGCLSSMRRDKNHPSMQPGYWYNNLPEEHKERLKNELKSEHVANVGLMTWCEPNACLPWYDRQVERGKDMVREEKLKFEQELLRNGWKPNYEL
jgi:hypothetical protein